MEKTLHWCQRNDRLQFIKDNIGIGKPVKSFYWDKGHPNGPEIHTVTDTGIIIIRNYNTNKYITTLIARPQQIKRYYESVGQVAPNSILKLCEEHQRKGYNEK